MYTGGGKWSASDTDYFTPHTQPPIPTEKEAGGTQDTVWTIWTGEKYLAQKVRKGSYIQKQPHCYFTVLVT